MKKTNLFLLCGASALCLYVTGCASVSSGEGNAYGNMGDFIQYHDHAYMKSKAISMPSGVDELAYPKKNGKFKSPFAGLPSFDQTTRETGSNGHSSDELSPKIKQALAEDTENKLAATNRFPVTQLRYGRADKSLREAARKGIVNLKEFDNSDVEAGQYILQIRYLIGTKDMLSGNRNEKTITMEWKCAYTDNNNQPVPEMPAFSIAVEDKIIQKVGRTGRVLEGVRWDSPVEQEAILLNLSRMAQLKLINQIYLNNPVGGQLTDIEIDDNTATVRASRATGLLPNMEMIIYARKKGNSEGNQIPLFNAVVQPSKRGTSPLTIWRASDKTNAQRIIKKLKTDKDAAMEEYDFFAVSDGMSGPPPFIETHVKK